MAQVFHMNINILDIYLHELPKPRWRVGVWQAESAIRIVPNKVLEG